jgi:hypothetical protein
MDIEGLVVGLTAQLVGWFGLALMMRHYLKGINLGDVFSDMFKQLLKDDQIRQDLEKFIDTKTDQALDKAFDGVSQFAEGVMSDPKSQQQLYAIGNLIGSGLAAGTGIQKGSTRGGFGTILQSLFAQYASKALHLDLPQLPQGEETQNNAQSTSQVKIGKS